MSYVGVVTQYICDKCLWNGSITQPIGYYLQIHCPDCDELLKIVDSDVE